MGFALLNYVAYPSVGFHFNTTGDGSASKVDSTKKNATRLLDAKILQQVNVNWSAPTPP